MSMQELPTEIITNITKFVKDYDGLYSLSLVCKEYNQNIEKISLLKSKLLSNFNKPKKIVKCVNKNCCYETKDIFIDYYRKYDGGYIHDHGKAMNYHTIYINLNDYKIFSPYCHECFKKYVLIGDKPKNKFQDALCEGFVDIIYL